MRSYELEHLSTRLSLNSSSHSGRSCAEFPPTFSLILSLVDAGCSVGVTASCDEDVADVGEDELDELVDRLGTTNGTQFAVLHSIFLPLLMRCGV